jgi:hypothetical protein
MNGVSLIFEMDNQPNLQRGTLPEDAPYSVSIRKE